MSIASMSDDVFRVPTSPRQELNGPSDFQPQYGFVRESLRVDRRRLDRMNTGPNEYFGESRFNQDPNQFIRNLMSETETEIMWGDQMRARKDPTILIYGEASRVKEARDRINAMFNSRQDRVTLKLDVSFDAHSHIIGRGGRSIQRVMDATSTHVHFPDSNRLVCLMPMLIANLPFLLRTSTFEKSNQVSIAGTASGAEKARCQVRDLTPLTVHYELPLSVFNRGVMDTGSVFYQMLQRNFSISVSIQPIRVFGEFLDFGEPSLVKISIRGTRGLIDQMEQGTAVLLDEVTGGTYNLSSTPATSEIEIAVQNHVTVMGRNECNVREIMQATNAIITFPEHSLAPFIGPAASSLPNRRSTVSIKGPNFKSVFLAWDSLQGFLPLILIFDLNEGQQIDSMSVARLMEKHKVSIQVKPKVRQNVNSIIVKGIEKDSRVLFEVRRELLHLDNSEVPFCCSNHFFKKFSETYERSGSSLDKEVKFSLSSEPQTPIDKLPKLSTDDGIWGPLFNYRASLGSYPTTSWLPHNCLGNNSEQTQHDFLNSDRQSVLDTTGPRDTLQTILIKSGLAKFAHLFEDLSLQQFVNLTPGNLKEFPSATREQLNTLIAELKWRTGGSQRPSF